MNQTFSYPDPSLNQISYKTIIYTPTSPFYPFQTYQTRQLIFALHNMVNLLPTKPNDVQRPGLIAIQYTVGFRQDLHLWIPSFLIHLIHFSQRNQSFTTQHIFQIPCTVFPTLHQHHSILPQHFQHLECNTLTTQAHQGQNSQPQSSVMALA